MAIRLPRSKSPTGATGLDTSAYSAPRTQIVPLTDYHGQYNDSKFYSWNGRIGRIQFLAYPSFFAFFALLILIALFMSMGGTASLINGGITSSLSSGLGMLLIVMWLGMIYIQIATTKRRLNDLNKTGWLSLILFIPVVSLFFYLYLLFSKGDTGSNNYGFPPPPPSRLAVWVGVILPIIGFLFFGIGAAIALPAYQHYVTKAKGFEAHKTQNTQLPQTPVASSVATTSTPTSANDESGLRKEEVVISAEQLGNGQTSTAQNKAEVSNLPVNSAVQTAPVNDAQASPNASGKLKLDQVQSKDDVPSEQTIKFADEATNKPRKGNQSTNSSKGTMSYEDFVKTSQSTVYIDH